MKQEMMNLLDEMYDDYYNYSSGIGYFSQFVGELKKYDFAEMLAYQAKFHPIYVITFVLATPSLWREMTGFDWIRVMSVLNPRPKPFNREIDHKGYIDILFLCKYLRVNAIELLLQQEHFSDKDKKKILQHFKGVDSLFMDELDLEDLDGDYFVHKDVLEQVRIALTSNGVIKPLNYSKEEFRKYVDEELNRFLTLEG